MGVLDVVVSLVSCIVMMSGCFVYASCLSSSRLFVMPLMFTCSMVMPVALDVSYDISYLKIKWNV